MTSLTWPRCRNARDLGGLPISDGGQLRAGALIRSDNLDQLDSHGLAAVQAAGVSRIVDLRSAWECEKYPSPFTNDERWLNVPLTDPADPDVAEQDLFEQYRMLIDDCPHRFAAAVTAIADAPPGCVVVACHAGKDRSGLVIALTLDLLGVALPAIAADYATAPETTTTNPLPELAPPQPDTILRVLGHLSMRYGGTARYLLQSGATSSQLTALTDRLH